MVPKYNPQHREPQHGNFQESTLAAVRKARNREIMSEYIRVQMSDLYDFQPCRATLTTIAFMQVNDENAYCPEDSPFKGDYIGWCPASQETLACRVGKHVRQIQRDLERFEKDGVIDVRSWTDNNGYPHKEYHVREDVVTAHQRKEGQPRPKRSKRVYKANKGSFSKGPDARRHRTCEPEPSDTSASDHGTSQPQATGHVIQRPLAEIAVKGVSKGVVLGCDAGRPTASSAPSAAVLKSADAFPNRKQSQNQPEDLGAVANQDQKQNQPQGRPVGVITKGEKKPLPNRICYADLYEKWLKNGKGRIPRCTRCGGTLFWEENHECPGFVPHDQRPDAIPKSHKPSDLKVLSIFADEDDLSGYEDHDDDHLASDQARAAAVAQMDDEW